MNNRTLMQKVKELDTQPLTTKEQSQRVMVQISVIRKAFGVKNTETNKPIPDYERPRVLSDQEIEKKFTEYVRYVAWAIKRKNPDKEIEYEKQIHYFIEAVKFFDTELAQYFTHNYARILKEQLAQ